MQLLLSPILWVGLGLLYLFNRNSKVKGTDLSIFDQNVNNSAVTTSGAVIKGVSITSARAKSIAISLWDELNNVFTDDAEILFLLKGLNEKDFQLVYDKFGRKDRSFLGAEGGYFGSQNDLIEWINIEVTDKEKRDELNKQFPNIF